MPSGINEISLKLGALEAQNAQMREQLQKSEEACKEREAELEQEFKERIADAKSHVEEQLANLKIQMAEQYSTVTRRLTIIEKWKAACNLTAVGWGSVCTAATVTGAALYNWWETILSVINRLKP